MNWRPQADRRRALPLPMVLEHLAATRDLRDPAKWRTAQGTLTGTGPKFMNWNQGVGGGGAIDLVMPLRQVGFGQALAGLERRFAGRPSPQPEATSRAQPWALPARAAENWPRVERYLMAERKLPQALLAPLVQSEIIDAAARANAVFLLVGPDALPVGAELRGTTALTWRGMALGSRKARGFFSLPSTPCAASGLCESAIDAIRCHALHPGYRCLSTSGARPDPAWLDALLAQGQPIYCGLDADPTGDALAQRMHDRHPSSLRLRPPAKDWNDRLRQRAR